MKLIEREKYLDKQVHVIGTPDIKVITGVRRCGKSKLLEAFKGYIEKNIPDSHIIHINFNLPEYEHLLSFRPLYDYIRSHIGIYYDQTTPRLQCKGSHPKY